MRYRFYSVKLRGPISLNFGIKLKYVEDVHFILLKFNRKCENHYVKYSYMGPRGSAEPSLYISSIRAYCYLNFIRMSCKFDIKSDMGLVAEYGCMKEYSLT